MQLAERILTWPRRSRRVQIFCSGRSLNVNQYFQFFSMMDSFKVPFGIAQDLLLIQSFIGTKEPVQIQEETPSAPLVVEDDIDSSGSEGNNSEDEIEAELLVAKAEPVEGSVYVSFAFVLLVIDYDIDHNLQQMSLQSLPTRIQT